MDQPQPGMTISPQKPTSEESAAPAEVQAASPQPVPEVPASQWQFTESAAATAPGQEMPETWDTDHEPSQSVSWTSSEFIAHEKSAGWYAMLAGGTVAASAIVFALTRDKVSTSVVIIAAVVLGIFAARKPRVLEYTLDDKGITIGAKLYFYDFFKSFSVVEEGAVSGIVLMPLKRFMPQLTMYYAADDENKIVPILADRLPMENHRADIVDRFMHRIRF